MMKYFANIITIIRSLLAIVVIILLKQQLILQLIGIVAIPVLMMLDMLDGAIARKTKTCSVNGSVYDIVADRFIEFSFFIFFAINGVCDLWVALIIVWRGLIIDAIRSLALRHGKTAFGEASLHQKRLTKLLTSSYFSRALYNTLKTVVFVLMAIQLYQPVLSVGLINVMVWFTVAWSVVRAAPVIVDGLHLLTNKSGEQQSF